MGPVFVAADEEASGEGFGAVEAPGAAVVDGVGGDEVGY